MNSKINEKKKTVNFQIDTGARYNVMSQDTFYSVGIKTALKPTSKKLTSFSGHKLKPTGIVQLPCKIQGNNFDIDFYVVDSSVPSVLGWSTCREIGLIQRLYNIHTNELPKQKDLPQDIDSSYKDLFEGLGCMPDTYSIKVDPSVKPVIHPPRKFPISILYFAKFVANMSDITAPLRQLLEKDIQWHWDLEQQSAFDLQKDEVTNAPVLRFYDPKKQ